MNQVLTARWSGSSVYVSYYGGSSSGSIISFVEGMSDFVQQGNATHTSNMQVLYPYGPDHIVGFGRDFPPMPTQSTPQMLVVNLYEIVGSAVTLVQNFNLDPNPESVVLTGFSETKASTIHVDFNNRKIVFPIQSTVSEPFSKGFYYLKVETSPVCMRFLPLTLCPTPLSQTYPLYTSRVFKHWNNQPGYNWFTGPSEPIYRAATIEQGT